MAPKLLSWNSMNKSLVCGAFLCSTLLSACFKPTARMGSSSSGIGGVGPTASAVSGGVGGSAAAGSSSSSSTGSAGPSTGTSGSAPSCDKDATIQITETGIGTGFPTDAGPPFGIIATTDAGLTIVLGEGPQPLESACGALSALGCGHCPWFAITLPLDVQPGTFTVGLGGVSTSATGYAGTVTVTQVGAIVKGTFNLADARECGLCGGTVQGTFDIAASCTPLLCPGPAGAQCGQSTALLSLPSGPGGQGFPAPPLLVGLGFDGGRFSIVTPDVQNFALDVASDDASGGFGPFSQILLDPQSPGVGVSTWFPGLVSGDLSGDHIPDLILASGFGVGVLLGRADGTFSAPKFYSPVADGGTGQPSIPALADVDEDGRLDVVVSDTIAAGVAVLHGNGDGTLRLSRRSPCRPPVDREPW